MNGMTLDAGCRTLLLTVLLAISAAPRLDAQPSAMDNEAVPCGRVERPEQADRVMKVLSTPDASLREALISIGIAPQRADAPRGVLRSTPECARLRSSLRRVVRAADAPPEGLRAAPLSFLELGDYYGIIVVSGQPTGSRVQRRGAAPLYLFDRSGMRFVARLAI